MIIESPLQPAGAPAGAMLEEYLDRAGIWADSGYEFDFWYGVTVEETYWLHVRRTGGLTFALSFFSLDNELVDVDLYHLSHAPISGLRATILNTPLRRLERYEPPLPVVALRLPDGYHHHFTLPRTATTLADQWLAEALGRLRATLTHRWQVATLVWPAHREGLRAIWPAWAGPPPL